VSTRCFGQTVHARNLARTERFVKKRSTICPCRYINNTLVIRKQTHMEFGRNSDALRFKAYIFISAGTVCHFMALLSHAVHLFLKISLSPTFEWNRDYPTLSWCNNRLCVSITSPTSYHTSISGDQQIASLAFCGEEPSPARA
jgi:hypothetical protein